MRAGFDKLPQNAPTVFNCTNEYEHVLVGTFHRRTELSGRGESSELASQSLGRVIRDAVISPSGYSGGGSHPFECSTLFHHAQPVTAQGILFDLSSVPSPVSAFPNDAPCDRDRTPARRGGS